MLFTALSAPELLIPDRRDGVLSMLASRPLTPFDYLGSRFASLATVVGSFMILPQLLLFFGQASTDPEGLFQGLLNAADTLPKILAVAAVYTIAYVPLGFVIASLSNRKAIATASYLAVMIALTAFAEAIVRSSNITGGRWVALLAPINTADAANVWIFGGSNPDSLLAAADIHPVFGIVALVVLGSALSLFALHRYRSLM
jgi:ABC-2 type transport system permease protein